MAQTFVYAVSPQLTSITTERSLGVATGGTIDIFRGGTRVSTRRVVLNVWRSDGTTKLYIDAPPSAYGS
jgi:hypothetical protein